MDDLSEGGRAGHLSLSTKYKRGHEEAEVNSGFSIAFNPLKVDLRNFAQGKQTAQHQTRLSGSQGGTKERNDEAGFVTS